MDIDINDDEILRTLAAGQSIDYSIWPSLLERLLIRLEKTAITDFQIRKTPTYPRAPSPSLSPKDDTSTEDSSSAPQPSLEDLPPICYKQLLEIQDTLGKTFPTHPPHTIQRLSELFLHPTQHHRSLPSYLHALDRIIHVTSPITFFPLPPAVPDPSVSSSVLSNGTPPDPLSISWSNPTTGSAPTNGGLGSDDALGGALLTPISWLNKRESSVSHGGSNGTGSGGASPRGEVRTESTETIDGPNGPGGVETVSVSVNGISSVGSHTMISILSSQSPSMSGEQGLRAEGGVTQGELLRQEQRAGVVPASLLRLPQRDMDMQEGGRRGDEMGLGEDDEIPHARGPEEIGVEDTGPQEETKVMMVGGGIDVEAAVGRRADFTDEKEVGKEQGDVDMDVKMEGEESSVAKRPAEDDIGSEAGEKRVKGEVDSESRPDVGLKQEIANGEEKGKESDMKKEEEKGEGEDTDMNMDADIKPENEKETNTEAKTKKGTETNEKPASSKEYV